VTANEAPLDLLFDLVAQDASGELVCVSSSLELHLYLQSGRIAWATDSSQPFAFVRHLLEHTALTREILHEVTETCRRDRLPLGETLLAWHVASLIEIRAALAHQIRGALASLEACAEGRAIFLTRRREYASYDTQLTFDVSALAPRERRSQPLEPPATPLLDRVRGPLREATWIEALEEHETIEQLPASITGVASRVPAAVADRTVLDGADHVALRTARGTLLGTALATGTPARRSLWCRLRPASAFGAPLSAMCRAAGIDRVSTPAPGPSSGSNAPSGCQTWGSSARALEVDEMRTLMERAREVEGILLLEDDQPVCGVGRERLDASVMSAIVRRRAPVLGVSLSPDTAAVGAELDEPGDHLASMVTGEADLWCFGAVLAPSGPSVWIFTDRQSAQGLGWAYLTTLCRQISLGGAPSRARAAHRAPAGLAQLEGVD
jgi:hypothetical protein